MKQVKKLISEGKAIQAVEYLKSTLNLDSDKEKYDRLLLFESQLSEATRSQLAGLITDEEGNKIKNRISLALLNFNDEPNNKSINLINSLNKKSWIGLIFLPSLILLSILYFKCSPNIRENQGVQIGELKNENEGNVQIENIQGDKIIYNSLQDDDPKLKPLIYSKIDVNIPYGYGMQAIDIKTSQEFNVYAQASSIAPSRKSQDIVINFDITNPNKIDLRIKDIYINVIEFYSVKILKTTPLASAGKIRKYYCNINSEKRLFNCKIQDKKFDYIKLSKGELERFGININSLIKGVYKLGVVVDYSIGDKEFREKVGEFEEVGFF